VHALNQGTEACEDDMDSAKTLDSGEEEITNTSNVDGSQQVHIHTHAFQLFCRIDLVNEKSYHLNETQ